jgi:hypothetical protein
VSKTPRAERKIAHARFHLGRLRAENAKVVGRDAVAIEADISACLGAIKSALYRLQKEAGGQPYKKTLAYWKGTLSPAERHDFRRMTKLRDLDVHEDDIPTSIKEKAIPALSVRGFTVSTPPGVLMPNPDPKGLPKFATAWVIGQEVLLEAGEAAGKCERYIDLLTRLVKEFQ